MKSLYPKDNFQCPVWIIGWNFAGYVSSKDSWGQHSGDRARAIEACTPEHGSYQTGSHMIGVLQY